MANFCSQCGAALTEDAKFCPSCGAAQEAAPQQAPQSSVKVGFSARVNDPEILAAVKKNRRSAGIASFFIVPLPLIGFLIYSLVTQKMEFGDALKFGALVSVIFLVFTLFSARKSRAENTYDATVIDKKMRQARQRNDDDDRNIFHEYITIVRTDDGKKKKIIEREGSQIWAWDYLNVGDRFRYHPQFAFPYEHYDKSKAPYIGCVACQTKNPVEADRCQKCGLPLLK